MECDLGMQIWASAIYESRKTGKVSCQVSMTSKDSMKVHEGGHIGTFIGPLLKYNKGA